MTVSIKYFAGIRERMGRSEDELVFHENLTAADVWKSAMDGAPRKQTLVAVNQEYVNWDHSLNDGDEVAFFPPVTGG